MELSQELAVTCVAVKEASEKEAMPGVPAALPMSNALAAPAKSMAGQATQMANQRVAQGQATERQQINDKEQQGQVQTASPMTKNIAPIRPANIGQPLIRQGYQPPVVRNTWSPPVPVKAAADPDLTQLRAKFESMEARERLLRRHAQKWEELSAARAAREEPSAVSTALQRMAPVPHTMGEAAVRAPLAALSGYGGYRMGAKLEPADVEELQRVLGASRAKGEGLRPIERNLSDLVGEQRAKRLAKALRQADPTVTAQALREADITAPGEDVAKLRKRMGKAVKGSKGKALRGLAGRARIKSEISNLFRQGQSQPLVPKMRPWRIGGALGGLALGGLLSGIPYAAHALYRKGEGGEAAYRAAQRAKELTEEAERVSAEREALL